MASDTKGGLRIERTCVWKGSEIAFGLDSEHTLRCLNAIESVGGDPATVGEMREFIGFVLAVNGSTGGLKSVVAEFKHRAEALLSRIGAPHAQA